MEPVEQIDIDGQVGALLVRASFSRPGIHFFTPESFSQQLAYMRHPKGKQIEPHIHNRVRREVFFTNEVLILKRGKVRADFYNDARQFVTSRVLEAGDVLLLASGGHGFEILEEAEMIEVKQGPYAADDDKVRFAPPTKATPGQESG
jgi:mannose-6-phosphate isomerase-like protein (cupin superfamily)